MVLLDSAALTGAISSSITFTGVIENDTGSVEYLNGADADIVYSELTFDPTPFFSSVPLLLEDGDSYSGPLFAVAISDVAAPGDYPGNSFIIEGGTDSGTFDSIGTATFEVTVPTVPEPSAIELFAVSIVLMVTVRGWRRKASAYKAE